MRFGVPDLDQLPAPQLIETLSAEAILAAQKAWVLTRWNDIRTRRPDLPPLDTLGLETEPMTLILEATSYRELLVRALVNDKARAVLLAKAVGSDLDHVGALYPTARATLVPATATTAAVMESDSAYRRRVQLTPEAFSTAGAPDAYVYWALTTDPVNIADAYAYRYDARGTIKVVVAGFDGADVPDSTIDALWTTFARTDITPLTDVPIIARAVRVDYDVIGELVIPAGPMATARADAAIAAVRAYGARRYQITQTAYLPGIIAAAMQLGIEDVNLTAPAGDVVCRQDQIPYMRSVQLLPRLLD